jgi:hypothetical protein
MKIRLKKTGKLFLAADIDSSDIFSRLDEGVYNCTVIRPKVQKMPVELRRAAQNRLYWQVRHDLEETSVNHLAGNAHEHWHREFKIRYMVPLLARESAGFAAMYSALEEVLRELGKATYENLLNGVIAELSTTRLSVSQFADYLTAILHFCRTEGVLLTVDRDLVAMAVESA